MRQGEFFRNVFAQGERVPLFSKALAWYGMASKNGRKNGTDWKAFSEDRELAQGLFRRNPIRKTIPKEKRTEKRNG